MGDIEVKASMKENGNDGYAVIKKSAYWVQVIITMGMFCITIALGAYYFFSIEPRISKLERQYLINAETNMNLKTYLETQGFKWVTIPIEKDGK